jgi:hypothetical protein
VSHFLTSLSVSALLALPFAGVAWVAARSVEPLASAAVEVLLRASAPLQRSSSLEQAPDSLHEPLAVSEPTVPAATQPKTVSGRAAKPQPPRPLFVAADKVLRLAQSGAQPRGAFVAETPHHPAGLRLSGVAALGIGVQDGDILIEALGVLPRSPGQIIGAILEARARQVRYVGGTLWRRGQTLHIVVEQPYLGGAEAASGAKQPLSAEHPQVSLSGRPTPS